MTKRTRVSERGREHCETTYPTWGSNLRRRTERIGRDYSWRSAGRIVSEQVQDTNGGQMKALILIARPWTALTNRCGELERQKKKEPTSPVSGECGRAADALTTSQCQAMVGGPSDPSPLMRSINTVRIEAPRNRMSRMWRWRRPGPVRAHCRATGRWR